MKSWKVLKKDKLKGEEEIISALLENRGLKSKKEINDFYNPKNPKDFTAKALDLDTKDITKAISRIKEAKKNKERVFVYGDYDADGVCATAILWEVLYKCGVDVLPYIPERFSEGYGINTESIEKLKTDDKNLKLIITVDNGIVAHDAIEKANELGVDVIITDHHQKERKLPKAYTIVHSTKTSGAGVAWFFANEVSKKIKSQNSKIEDLLSLVAIGTIADQIRLLGINRSFVKYGLEKLNKTKRIGLRELFHESTLEPGNIGTYEVGYIIAPRINAMGRLEHAIDSLRLICTNDPKRAGELARLLGKTNKQRQKIVEEVVVHARNQAKGEKDSGAIIIAHESYHEGVIGLAAGELVKKFYRPAIVLSKGNKVSKASARSIDGFNIIQAIRKFDDLLLGGGGHPMAAGFSIENSKLKKFIKKFNYYAKSALTKKILTRQLVIDIEVNFGDLSWSLIKKLKEFEPTGLGNYAPVFLTKGVVVMNARAIGFEGKHLKMKLESKGHIFDAIGFGMGEMATKLPQGNTIDIAYNFEENVWNGQKSLQLKLKDMSI